MTATVETANFLGKPVDALLALIKQKYPRLVSHALIGFVLLLTNFPKFLTNLIDANIDNPTVREALHAPIAIVQFALVFLIGPDATAFFERAMTCNFLLMWLFLSLLVVFSARRRGIRNFAYGVGGIVFGYLALHGIAWAAVAVVITIKGAILVGHWVGLIIAAIVDFVFHYTWPLFFIIAAGGALYFTYRLKERIARVIFLLLRMFRKYATHLLGITGVIGLVWLLFPAVYRWVILPVFNFLRLLLTPIVAVIVLVAKWIIIIVLAILFVFFLIFSALMSLALLGSLFISQLQAGWFAARSLRYVLIAGFAIGSALGLIVLVSVANNAVADSLNQAWMNALVVLHLTDSQSTTQFVTFAFEALLPQSVENFIFSELTDVQAPALDSFIFLCVLSLASVSVLFRVFSIRKIEDEYVPISLAAWEYVKIIGGLFVSLVLIFLAAVSGDSLSS